MSDFERLLLKVRNIIFNRVLLFILLVAAVAGAGYMYMQYRSSELELASIKKDPSAVALEETKKWVELVGKHITLPKGEEPLLATVKEVEKLQKQAFFAHAKNGDKVLIYTKAKKAILYRPETDRIIEVAPVNVGDEKQSMKVAIYNGTTNATVPGDVIATLQKAFPNVKFSFSPAVNAKKQDYAQVIIVDLTGKKAQDAQNYAKALGGSVENLPAGETAPKDVDILIIAGSSVQKPTGTLAPSATPTPTPEPTATVTTTPTPTGSN